MATDETQVRNQGARGDTTGVRPRATELVTDQVESRAGAVADRSGAVHASGCRRCGPETVLRLQSPLIKPGVRFCRVDQPLLAFTPTDPGVPL